LPFLGQTDAAATQEAAPLETACGDVLENLPKIEAAGRQSGDGTRRSGDPGGIGTLPPPPISCWPCRWRTRKTSWRRAAASDQCLPPSPGAAHGRVSVLTSWLQAKCVSVLKCRWPPGIDSIS